MHLMANRKEKYIMIKVLLEEMGKARILWVLHYREERLVHQLSTDDFLQWEIQEKKLASDIIPLSDME